MNRMSIPIFKQGRRAVVLLSDDDGDFHELAQDAFASQQLAVDLHHVGTGEACLSFLRSPAAAGAPRPDLLMLDMNMPRGDALQVLCQVRADPGLRTLPVVICSASARQEDVDRMYACGCNSFIPKPGTLAGMRRTMSRLARYWFDVAVLPGT
jgi:CheY-like chemotaxis protein